MQLVTVCHVTWVIYESGLLCALGNKINYILENKNMQF